METLGTFKSFKYSWTETSNVCRTAATMTVYCVPEYYRNSEWQVAGLGPTGARSVLYAIASRTDLSSPGPHPVGTTGCFIMGKMAGACS
jgi:hypothetical protein